MEDKAIVDDGMQEKVVVRDVLWEDFGLLAKNFLSYYDEMKENPDLGILVGGKKPKMTEEIDWFSAFYKRLLEGDAVASVAEVGGKVVGMCDINRTVLREDVKHRGLLGIAILKEYRGRGIGTMLVTSCIKKAKGKFEIIMLSAFENNRPAMRLYEKCGFKEYGVGKKFIKRNEHYIDEHFYCLEI